MRPSRFVPCLAIPLVAALTACDFDGTGLEIVPEFEDVFSFEASMENWSPRGVDLGDPPATWEIARTTERADDGATSVRLRLDNLSNQAKIWLERRYQVPPDQEYEVTISFALASADFGTSNLWRVVAGAAPDAPVAGSPLIAVQDTGNGSATDAGFQWVQRTTVTRAKSDADGEIFVYVGVWGTSPFLRTYAVDDLRVTFLRKGISAPPGPT